MFLPFLIYLSETTGIPNDQSRNPASTATSSIRTGRDFMKTAVVLAGIIIISFFGSGLLTAETKTASEPLPEVTFTVPDNQEYLDYLGLSGKPGTSVTLGDIDADILLIELFNRYCPYCQNAAPDVNELYELMKKKNSEGLKLVLIGIGVKNSEQEVKTFRQEFNIEFPMFTDPDLSIYKTLEGAGTPTFIAIRKEDGRKVIFFRKSGGFTDPQEFLKDLLDKANLQ